MARFHERLKAALHPHGEPLAYAEKLLNDLQIELKRRFPICHLDTDSIDDELIKIGERIAGLQSRCTPTEPVKEPEPTPAPAPEPAPAPTPDASTESEPPKFPPVDV